MSIGGTSTSGPLLDRLATSSGNAELLAVEVEHLHRLAMVGVVAAGLAHEINNILTPVIAYAHAAAGDDANEALRMKALAKSLQGAEDVTAIAREILGFASKSDKQAQCANIALALEQALHCIARDPARDGVTLVKEISSDLHVAIAPVSLQQVFMNLVLNSLHAMKRRRGRIEITAQREADEVAITVCDTGPGIPGDIRKHLFSPFVTVATADSRSEQSGSGLGLAVCRMLINSAGGEIDVESEHEVGTTFNIRLPVAHASSKNAA